MRIHIVQKGDTLWKIAKKYNVDFEQLKSLNSHLSDPDMIMPGMKIKVPSSYSPPKKQQKEMPTKESPVKEKPIKESPHPKLAPPPKPPKHEEYLPPMPEAEIPIQLPSMPPPMPLPKPIHHMPKFPCGCAPIMPIPCQPIHWHGYHYPGPGMMHPEKPMGETKEHSKYAKSSNDMHAMDYDDYQHQQGMQSPQMPMYGQQGKYGQPPMWQYGMHDPYMPMYGQQQGMYGQQMPMYGYQQEGYGQPAMYGHSGEHPYGMYGQHMTQHHEDYMHGSSMMPPQLPYDQQMSPIWQHQNLPYSNDGDYRETEEEKEEEND